MSPAPDSELICKFKRELEINLFNAITILGIVHASEASAIDERQKTNAGEKVGEKQKKRKKPRSARKILFASFLQKTNELSLY